jgi:hypothetical protein
MRKRHEEDRRELLIKAQVASGTGARPSWCRVKSRVDAVDRNGCGPTADEHNVHCMVSLADMIRVGGGKWSGFQSLAGLDEVSWRSFGVPSKFLWVGWWWCAGAWWW